MEYKNGLQHFRYFIGDQLLGVFYIILAVAFGFMLHVRGRNKQKFSEGCRPLLGNKVDGVVGKLLI